MRETGIGMLKRDVESAGKYYGLSLNYSFKYKDDFYPVEYEYYLSDDDLNYLLDLIGDKFDIKFDGQTNDILNFLSDFADRLACKEYENVIWVLEDFLNEQDIHDKMLEHCKSEAENEFPDQFEYWVDEEDYPEYVDTSNWEDIE